MLRSKSLIPLSTSLFIWKSLGLYNFSQLLITTIIWQNVIGKEKIVGLYVSDS